MTSPQPEPTTTGPRAEQVANAAHAIDAHGERIFPGEQIDHRGNPRLADAMLRCLLLDLLHYADAHGIDFDQAYATARDVHADDIAAEQSYTVGNEVQLRYGLGTCRGTVTGIETPASPEDPPAYRVHIPGEPVPRILGAAELRQAEPFGPVHTLAGVISSANMAERLLINLCARITAGSDSGQLLATEHYADRDRLMTALANWSGANEVKLRASLNQQAGHAHAELHAPLGNTLDTTSPPAPAPAPSGPADQPQGDVAVTAHPSALGLQGFPAAPLADLPANTAGAPPTDHPAASNTEQIRHRPGQR